MRFAGSEKEEELGDFRWDYHLTRELVGEEAVYVLHIGEVTVHLRNYSLLQLMLLLIGNGKISTWRGHCENSSPTNL